MELNPIEEIIASWPLWVRLLPAAVMAALAALGVWATRKDVRGK